MAIAAADLHLEFEVSHDFGALEGDAPRLEEFIEIGTTVGDAAKHLILLFRINERQRVEKGDELAAAHDELVEGILRLVGNLARMDGQQHLDVVVDFIHVHRDAADIEIIFQFIDQHPRFLAALAHLHHHRIGGHAENRQRTHDPDDRFVRGHDA